MKAREEEEAKNLQERQVKQKEFLKKQKNQMEQEFATKKEEREAV